MSCSYDGEAPAAFFWAASACDPVSLAQGFLISEEPVPGPNYRDNLTLPVAPNVDFDEIGCVSFYCIGFNADFGSFEVPSTKAPVKE